MKKILIIEDEIPVLQNLAELIEEVNKFSVLTASNGYKGLELAFEHLPDLIICDIMMPELNGFDVLTKLKENEITSTIPFIFLTARSEKEDMRHGMELGADDYITKPFTYNEVFKSINSRLSQTEKLVNKSEKQLNELRLNIASTLPHELRTPLNGILTSANLLIEHFDKMDVNDAKQVHKNIFTSAKRLNRLITNYLSFAELELLFKDKDKLQFLKSQSYVDFPDQIIRDISLNIASNYSRVNDITLELINHSLKIHHKHLYKIIEEIIDNAFKFSEENKLIKVSSNYEKEYYVISVKNEGVGITNEQISKIGAYIQFDRKIHEQQGSGLGLIIAKRILQIYDGFLDIESEIGNYAIVKVFIKLNK